MNLQEIEERVVGLDLTQGQSLIYELLLAYGLPKAGVARLRSGSYNRSTVEDEILWKDRVLDRFVKDEAADLHALIDSLSTEERVKRERPRFVIVRNGSRLVALDTKTRDTLDIALGDLEINAAFFLPWAGIEKQQLENLHYADVKAAERMARLYMEIVKANAVETQQDIDELNIFFSRLLFCFFAEDTDVFPEGAFTGAIASLTNPTGEDAASFLDGLFKVLDTPEGDRAGVAAHFLRFGYVNGKLFSQPAPAPRFTAKARSIVLDAGRLNWSQINPDIFGSMIQAVVHPGARQAFGMHYTSVENILKLIRPLFLDSLEAEFDRADTVPKLRRFIQHLARIKVFDPACGSGNFLVIAYKELRRLEHRALSRIGDLDPASAALFAFSEIELESFYGIEIDGFAHEVAMLSLWLAKHQMNREFRELFGAEIPLIPLRDAGNIVWANATERGWESVCPKGEGREIYVVGNPPYVGSSMQNAEQKAEFVAYFGTPRYPKNLDYIALWFLKGAAYIADGRADLAFVTTNSVCQGDHVGLMWPGIYARGAQIAFAYQSFRWTNQARGGAGVTCVIIGLSASPPKERLLVSSDHAQRVPNIGPYLLPTPHSTIVHQRRASLSGLPEMVFGSKPTDGGHLNFTPAEREEILAEDPRAEEFMRRYAGAQELLSGGVRYCFWIPDADAERALEIAPIARRAEQVTAMRLQGSTTAQAMADRPYRFLQRAHREGTYVAVPRYSSERRSIVPMAFLDSRTVVSDGANAIYDAPPWLFAILQSKMHASWVGTVGGRMKTDYRYSAMLCYNTYPVPTLSEVDRQLLTDHAFAVLETRERHSDLPLGALYLPEKTPADLLRTHESLDAAVDEIYGAPSTPTDTDRLETLFRLYADMTAVA